MTGSITKKVLITGASGYLAQALIPIAAKQATVIGVARSIEAVHPDATAISLDLTDRAAVFDLLNNVQPDAIIHCAACNPGGSDADMIAVNESGTCTIAKAASEMNCRLVSVSSDTVFSGTQAPYADNAPASPLADNTYAVSKANGEALITARMPSAAIVRTSLIYGTDQIDRGTAGFIDRLKAGETLKLFNDVIRQPVERRALSTGLCKLALDQTNQSGFINIMGNEAMSRYTFGVRMLDYWGIEYSNQLESVSGEGIKGLPIDLRVIMNRTMELEIPTPGVSAVLQSAAR